MWTEGTPRNPHHTVTQLSICVNYQWLGKAMVITPTFGYFTCLSLYSQELGLS